MCILKWNEMKIKCMESKKALQIKKKTKLKTNETNKKKVNKIIWNGTQMMESYEANGNDYIEFEIYSNRIITITI